MSKAIVIKSHQSKFPNPIKLSKDEIVQTGQRDTEWEGWIWSTSKNKIEGWVPESYLEIKENHAIVKKDYDATELNVQVNETVTLLLEESGWYYCQKENGTRGWVPSENIKIE